MNSHIKFGSCQLFCFQIPAVALTRSIHLSCNTNEVKDDISLNLLIPTYILHFMRIVIKIAIECHSFTHACHPQHMYTLQHMHVTLNTCMSPSTHDVTLNLCMSSTHVCHPQHMHVTLSHMHVTLNTCMSPFNTCMSPSTHACQPQHMHVTLHTCMSPSTHASMSICVEKVMLVNC